MSSRRRPSSCCWLTKQDFLPEKSFESWGSYWRALREIPTRFVDRVTARSLAQAELTEVKARSNHEMKKSLKWWDLIWLGIGAVVGAGIFVLTGLEARYVAGPAVVLSYVVSGFSAMLSVFCYTEFAVEIPVAGGSFAYLRVELGDFVAFIAAGNIVLEYIIGSAAVARSWTSYFATLCNHHPNDFRITTANHLHLDPISVVVIAVTAVLASVSTKATSRFNYVAAIVHVLVILFIIVAGFFHADISNYSPLAPFGARGIFQASAVLFFAYGGFDAISTMAEETSNPGRDIPIGLVGSMMITVVIYCSMAVVLCLMQPYSQVDPDAPFSVAFEKVGMGWAKYLVAAGALKGMTTVLLVGALGQARYLTHIARTHMLPPWLAQVNERTGTPINATCLMAVATASVAFFTDLDILSNLLSISTIFIFVLVAVALLVRRYYYYMYKPEPPGVTTTTSSANRNKMIACILLILAASVATAAYWGLAAAGSSWVCYCVTLPIWLLGTAGLWLFVPEARRPKTWGVPLVPWLPSLSILINVFLLGSIDKDSFIRFGVWTALIFIYYLLFALHASYDTAREQQVIMEPEG